MPLREEVLRRTEGGDYEDPDGQYLDYIESRTDRIIVLTKVDGEGEPDTYSAASSTDDGETDYPTNDDGEPLCVGKDDGQCSRTVDEPFGVCWQHEN